MALYPGYGVRNRKYEEGIVIAMPSVRHPGSDQNLLFLGQLPYPFAPPIVSNNPPVETLSEPNPPFPNPDGILTE